MSKYFVLIWPFWLIALWANAQDKDLTLDNIINNHIEALGGRERLQSVHAMKMTGLHFYRGLESSLTILSKRPNLFRVEIADGTGRQVYIFDGENARQLTGEANAREIRDPRIRIFMDINDDFEGALVDYKAKGHKVKLAGSENIDGQTAYKLQVTLRNGRNEVWYLDRSSFRLIKRSTTFKRGDREFKHDLFFMEYKEVSGLMIPHYLERVYEPHYVRGYEITKVEINPDLEIGLFQGQSVSDNKSN